MSKLLNKEKVINLKNNKDLDLLGPKSTAEVKRSIFKINQNYSYEHRLGSVVRS